MSLDSFGYPQPRKKITRPTYLVGETNESGVAPTFRENRHNSLFARLFWECVLC